MSIVIRISKQTYERLQGLATPFVDTPEIVIDRLLEFYVQQVGSNNLSSISDRKEEKISLETSPDLTHTKIIDGQVAGSSVRKWNTLLQAAIWTSLSNGATKQELANLLQNIDLKERNDSGYRYLPNLGISLQGVSACTAWDQSCQLAKRYGFPLHVKFEWRFKKGAAYPGRLGELKFDEPSGATSKFIS